MPLNTRLSRVIYWLLEGYPAGVPPKDYITLVALLRRRLSDDEILEIADEIASLGYDPRETASDIGVSITRLTDALPSPQDIVRVAEHLNRYHDWPLEAS